jgi:hypothetical protein
MQEQAVATQPLAQALDRAVRDPELVGDLAEGGAGEQAMEDRLEEPGMAEPVGASEGL